MQYGEKIRRALVRLHEGDPESWHELMRLRRDEEIQQDSLQLQICAAATLIASRQCGRFQNSKTCLDDLIQSQEWLDSAIGDVGLILLTGTLIGIQSLGGVEGLEYNVAKRLAALVEAGLQANLTIAAGCVLLEYLEINESLSCSARLRATVSGRLKDQGASPFRVAAWYFHAHRSELLEGQTPLAKRTAAAIQDAARLVGLGRGSFMGAMVSFRDALQTGDWPLARIALVQAERIIDRRNLSDALQLEIARSDFSLHGAQYHVALSHLHEANRLCAEMEAPASTRFHLSLREIQALTLAGRVEAAHHCIDGLTNSKSEQVIEMLALLRLSVTAHEATRASAHDASDHLESLWYELCLSERRNFFRRLPALGSDLCRASLNHGIEVSFVRSVILASDLIPPPSSPASWPWRLRIFALGGFSIWRDDQPLSTDGKAQRRPLELLRSLVALGAFREESAVDVAVLVDTIWSDEFSLDPKSSFEIALSRLRKRIGVDGAIRIADGRIYINSRIVWCDIFDFEVLCDELEESLRSPTASDPRLKRLNSLYRGRLFGNISLEKWEVAARERQTLRYTRVVLDAGSQLEAKHLWGEAQRIYEAGLVRDVLAESLHRALIRCHMALGQRAEAHRAFLRCSSVLRAELGVPPSDETRDALHQLNIIEP